MEESKKKSIFREWWFYFIILVFIFVIYLIWPKSPQNNSGYSNINEFAQCLTDNGVKMYGTEWCSHCKNQKELFGSAFKKVNYVDCDLRKEECLAALVTGYPTWSINGQNYPGEQSLEKLSALSGCELVRG